MYSLTIPVYKNEETIPLLIETVAQLNEKLDRQLEVVFVVDGSPDQSYALLKAVLPQAKFKSKLILLSRNFGSFAAIRAGLQAAEGKYYAVMAADLQEPASLILDFFTMLPKEPIDVVFGMRQSRHDPFAQKWLAKIYWYFYKKFIIKDMPPGGIDIFACNRDFRDQLLNLNELNSSLIGLAFWLGFKRKMVSYKRLEREHGKSAWSLSNRFKYAMDSSFAFTDLPIKLLYGIGFICILLSFLLSMIVVFAKLFGFISVPGYAATMLTIGFFAALNSIGLGIIGSYVWRAFENTKMRPQSIIMSSSTYHS